ncbi:hypothetical protein [Streptomyces albofaciens]|nr:hypothetical protein [Streptomyces albofaciens]
MAPGLLVEYVVAHGLIVVVGIEVFDEVLLEDQEPGTPGASLGHLPPE